MRSTSNVRKPTSAGMVMVLSTTHVWLHAWLSKNAAARVQSVSPNFVTGHTARSVIQRLLQRLPRNVAEKSGTLCFPSPPMRCFGTAMSDVVVGTVSATWTNSAKLPASSWLASASPARIVLLHAPATLALIVTLDLRLHQRPSHPHQHQHLTPARLQTGLLCKVRRTMQCTRHARSRTGAGRILVAWTGCA